MKKILLSTILLISTSYASIHSINSFEADFVQSITDDKDKTLSYSGHVIAKKPQYAKWNYKEPVQKIIYISHFEVTIVEPEIEQVIIRKIESNFDFFQMIKNAKEVSKNKYVAHYKNTAFKITKKDNLIYTIAYKDEFENDVLIKFKKQKQDKEIDETQFQPKYSLDFDIIQD